MAPIFTVNLCIWAVSDLSDFDKSLHTIDGKVDVGKDGCSKPLCWIILPRSGLDMSGHCSQDWSQPGNCILELRGEEFKCLVLGSAVSLTKVFPSGLGPSPDSPGAYMMFSHLVVTGPSCMEGNYPINLKIRFSLNTCCIRCGDGTRDTPSGSSTSLRHL